jgi:hypothetical protein
VVRHSGLEIVVLSLLAASDQVLKAEEDLLLLMLQTRDRTHDKAEEGMGHHHLLGSLAPIHDRVEEATVLPHSLQNNDQVPGRVEEEDMARHLLLERKDRVHDKVEVLHHLQLSNGQTLVKVEEVHPPTVALHSTAQLATVLNNSCHILHNKEVFRHSSRRHTLASNAVLHRNQQAGDRNEVFTPRLEISTRQIILLSTHMSERSVQMHQTSISL